MSYTYQYPHPAVATDCVVFGFDGKEIRILLIERGVEPYKGSWAFPGGFMRMDETAEACARRKLSEETNLMVYTLKQFGTFTEVHRDPRERVISIAYYALVRPADVVGGDDATQAPMTTFFERLCNKSGRISILSLSVSNCLTTRLRCRNFSGSMNQFSASGLIGVILRRRCYRLVSCNWWRRTRQMNPLLLPPIRYSSAEITKCVRRASTLFLVRSLCGIFVPWRMMSCLILMEWRTIWKKMRA